MRRATFHAAIEQFEQLMAASEVTPPAARPLPLFYALSQAGRAIAAAHGTHPVLRGHGLRWERGVATDLLAQRIEPQGSPSSSFKSVAQATGSPQLTGPVELGAVWAALPELRLTPAPASAGSWPTALYVAWNNSENTLSDRLEVSVIGLPATGSPPAVPGSAEVAAALLPYPDALDFELTGYGQGLLLVSRHDGEAVAHGSYPVSDGQTVDERRALLDAVAPEYRWSHFRNLTPVVGDGNDHLSPLMLWWVLLFGLSMYARYEPAAWTQALDVNSSELAVPLEAVLLEALDAVPHLLYDALVQDRALLPSN